jgi:hypothetical protein
MTVASHASTRTRARDPAADARCQRTRTGERTLRPLLGGLDPMQSAGQNGMQIPQPQQLD